MKLRLRSLALACAFAIAASGCYVGWNLTRKVHKWNGSVSSSKFVDSIITWGLIIIPVYELSLVADFFIFNTIETFTGSNPISRLEDGSAQVRVAGHDYLLRPSGAGAVEVSRDGVVVGRATLAGASVTARDTSGRVLATLPTSATIR